MTLKEVQSIKDWINLMYILDLLNIDHWADLHRLYNKKAHDLRWVAG